MKCINLKILVISMILLVTTGYSATLTLVTKYGATGGLAENIGTTVDYELLMSHIWDTESIAGSSLRTLVYSLRKQLPDLPIRSFSKMGYALHVEE